VVVDEGLGVGCGQQSAKSDSVVCEPSTAAVLPSDPAEQTSTDVSELHRVDRMFIKDEFLRVQQLSGREFYCRLLLQRRWLK